MSGNEFVFEPHDPIPGWPDEETLELWAANLHSHPLLCFYQQTKRVVPMTIGTGDASPATA